ncbi:MAG TPA: hypothetical protein VIO94_17680 [Phenylobacterium sp.]
MSQQTQPPFDRPIRARPVDGEVAITGPGHIHGSMTPKAAKDSADHLREVAQEAEDQPGEDGGGTSPAD